MSVLTNSGQLHVAVGPGAGIPADNAGLLSFDNGGNSLNAFVPRWVSAEWQSGGFQLTGLGAPLLAYQLQTSTNLSASSWTVIGTSTTDTNGVLQFLHPSPANSSNRFYRLAR